MFYVLLSCNTFSSIGMYWLKSVVYLAVPVNLMFQAQFVSSIRLGTNFVQKWCFIDSSFKLMIVAILRFCFDIYISKVHSILELHILQFGAQLN